MTVEPSQGYALVKFADIVAAFMAQQSLNNFYLSKYNASLAVKWVISQKDEGLFLTEEEQMLNENQGGQD